MQYNDEPLTGRESLALIEEMIHKAKNSYHESGTSALLWGSVVMFCSAVTFGNTWWKSEWLYQVWLLTFIAVIPQIIISIRESKTQRFKSHTDNLMNGIWIAFGICIGLLTFYVNVVKPQGSSFLFLMLYGIPTFAVGTGERFRPMVFGGIFCWVAAIVSVYTAQRIDLILFFAAAFFAWFLPGLILRRKYLKQKRVHV